ncbi:hypothetical protein CGMCC3_g17830 [Colletotrichum fructicola]|nr:uncharacterized protein CGMCC3_g17830 [Colletotrichum fructicola]KAE9565993.1 hypothetical protein CGMCC3_g17830 [Colletotrichum fructicola]KAF4417378.1 hypothetical protein CFRS1_v015810 [Colletotrichum fructicola]
MDSHPVITFIDGAALVLTQTKAPADDNRTKPHMSEKEAAGQIMSIWQGNEATGGPMVLATKNITDLWLLSGAMQAHANFNQFRHNLWLYTTDELNVTLNASLVVPGIGMGIGAWLYHFSTSGLQVVLMHI